MRSGLMRPQFEAAGCAASSCGEQAMPSGAGPIEEKPARVCRAAEVPEKFAPRVTAFFVVASFEIELARPLGAVLAVGGAVRAGRREESTTTVGSCIGDP